MAEVPVDADGTPATERSVYWLYEPGAITPGARYENGQLHYVVRDHMGTLRELLTESGTVVWAQKLSVWGRSECFHFGNPAANDDESRPGCPWRFAGQWADEESGLYYNRFRYYDNESGQYVSSDPIGLAGGVNLYGYVSNPLKYFDPFGLCKGMPTEHLPDAPPGDYNYRGIHSGHPEWDNALNGKVVPGDIYSKLSAEEHNLGGFSENSPFTSWTDDPGIARRFAGEDGIVLRVPTGSPAPGDSWSWNISTDDYFEREILLKGQRSGDVEVFLP